ncbi:MAG: hypothetical protein J7L80_01070 [Thermoplasmata archaeon]|nr:hypothetical protein [Thermoplasmata archaeon]
MIYPIILVCIIAISSLLLLVAYRNANRELEEAKKDLVEIVKILERLKKKIEEIDKEINKFEKVSKDVKQE